MRSLRLLAHQSAQVPGSKSGSRSFIANDNENNVVYVALEDEIGNVRVLMSSVAPDNVSAFTELARIPAEKRDGSDTCIVGLTYLSDLQVLCMALHNGDILLISKERFDKGEDAVEIVGSVETGIEAMAWSPDQDLVVIVTGSKNILEMTQDFDTIVEFPLHVEEEGEGVQHSVGWGRKETQFHGSAGKQAALSKVDTSKFTTSPDDDYRPRIAWRGDGSFFVCSDVDPRKGARVARIYSREGVLQNTSEPVDKLEHVLDWRPSGNMIVSSQRLPHRHDIVFIERNGLRHGEFTLRERREHKLLEVTWNADSTVLGIWLETEVPGGATRQKSVQLWTSNNYHWYLKQHLVLDDEDIIAFKWDTEAALTAHALSSDGRYHRYSFTWDVLASTSVSEDNSAYVAVIDGASVLLTPFSYQNVPPPMCSLTLTTDDNVQQLAFGPNSSGTKLAVATNEKVHFHDLPVDGRGDTRAIGTISLSTSEHVKNRNPVRHLQWVDATHIIYACYNDGEESDVLYYAEAVFAEGALKVLGTLPLGMSIGRLYYNFTFNDLILEGVDGSVFKVHVGDTYQLTTSKVEVFPAFCPWIATTRIGADQDNCKEVVIGLTERGKLYANDRLLSAECTSFYLRSDWLVFTTTSHTARLLPLNIDFEDFKLADNIPDANDESYRRVERGSKIVLATQSEPSLVLQMPRGNLETINPRAFVLAQIRDDLKNLKYRSAFIACRRNRIDLNILYDEYPDLFFENIPRFIEQVPEVDYLNLFLSNLRNVDTSKTLYKRVGRQAEPTEERSTDNKVNKICEAFRNILMGLGRERYIQSILSTYVKSTPPDLESALQLLAEIKESNINEAEEALRYTIFLCDAERLYNVALGMYNFPMVLMVAQQAQMDPREYLPFLQELQKLEKYYQRYRIDDHLKRYEKALRNLSRCGDEHFEELLQYMQQHSLYLTALDEYAKKPQQKRVILEIYGDHLSERNAYEEAGIAYEMADKLDKALNAYRMAGSWQQAFSLAKRMEYTRDNIQGLAYDISEYLKDKRRYQDAAVIAVDYLQDIEEAVDCLLKGSHWQEAVRVSRTHDRSDLLETHVIPGLREGVNQADEDLEEMISQFQKQTSRLKELRERKPDPALLLPPDENLDNIDMFSDTTSMVSQFTRYTQATSRVSTVSSISSNTSRKTSKLRRREQRKRERGKKGSIFEEEYLVKSLKRLYDRASNMQNDIHDLLRALVPFGIFDEAKAIQSKFAGFLVDLQSAIPTIFVPIQLQPGRFASPEELEAFKEPVVIEKPTIADVKWKLEILS